MNELAQQTDALLLRMNADLFTTLYTRYHDCIFAYIQKRINQIQVAEDLTNEVFLRAWKSDLCFENMPKAQAWLYRVAANMVVDLKRHERIVAFLDLESLGERYTVDRDITSYPEREQVQQVISHLAPVHQQALHEWMEDVPYPPGQADKQKMRRLRAKRHFRAAYEQMEGAAS